MLPVLMISDGICVFYRAALDDPICLSKFIPYDYYQTFKNRVLAVTPQGSHCAWLSGAIWERKTSWAHTASLEFLQACLDWKKEENER